MISGETFLDTGDSFEIRSNQKFIGTDNFSSFVLQKNNTDIFDQKTKGIQLIAFSVNLDIGNINRGNSVFQFYSSNTGGYGGTLHTVNILDLPGREGETVNYTSAAGLRADILSALNTATGLSGLTFSFVVKPYNPNLYDLKAAGGNFCFALNEADNSLQTNIGITRGKYMWNPSRSQDLTSDKTCGDFIGLNTRWIDVYAPALVEDQTIPTLTSNQKSINGFLTRIYLTPDQAYNTAFQYFISIQNPRLISKNKTRSIRTIDLQLLDEYANLLILDNLDDSTASNSSVGLVFQTL